MKPPTENVRAGADEDAVRAILETHRILYLGESHAAVNAAYAAGRARGIEEERKRREGIAREHDLCRDSACRVSSMIADAIAKETGT